MELGLATFADLSSGVSPEQRMRDLLEEAQLADELGLDVGAVAHRDAMRSIELFGTEVAPRVREELARRDTATQTPEVIA